MTKSAGEFTVTIKLSNGPALEAFCQAYDIAKEAWDSRPWDSDAQELFALMEMAADGLKPGDGK
jgi:hypothetical protein